MKFRCNTFDIAAGFAWQGLNLYEKDWTSLNLINAIKSREKYFPGLGYLNFLGIHGFSIFKDIKFLQFKRKLIPCD